MTRYMRVCTSILATAAAVALAGCVVVPLNPDGTPAYPVPAV